MRTILLILLTTLTAWAQSDLRTRPITCHVETGVYVGSSLRTPFWLGANQFGIVPTVLPAATLRGGLKADYPIRSGQDDQRLRKTIRWAYGIEAVANIGHGGEQVILPEAYVKARLGAFELMAGRRREVYGLADSTIGLGSYAWSGNALPLPRIQLSTPDYTPIPFTGKLLFFKAMFAHGWFETNRYVQNSFLHQKALYVRLGKPSWAVKLYGGLTHQAQWGGRNQVLPEGYIRNGRLPSGLSDYIDVVTAKSIGARPDVDTTRYSPFDRENRIGNHLGTVDVGLEVGGRHLSLLVYRQSVYDDGSLFYLTNIGDGLNGIRLTNNRAKTAGFQVRSVVVEFLSTMSQGGPEFIDNDEFRRGKDNYFNHGQFRDGYSYMGRTIGTPFLMPGIDTRPELERYAFTNNNRVQVLHAALSGSVGGVTFLLKSSVSNNFGTYDKPFPERLRQISSFLSVGIPFGPARDWQAILTVADDRGKLLPDAFGAYAGARYTWNQSRYRIRR